MVLHLGAIKPGRLLRINQPDAGEGTLVAQIFFPAGIAPVNFLDWMEPALVVEHTGKFCEPRAQIIGDSISDPKPNLRFALDAVLPTIRFLNAYAENADNRFA